MENGGLAPAMPPFFYTPAWSASKGLRKLFGTKCAVRAALAYHCGFPTVSVVFLLATTPFGMSTTSTIPGIVPASVLPSRRLLAAPMMDWTENPVPKGGTRSRVQTVCTCG